LLQPILTGTPSTLRWLPPYLFLGIYEHLLCPTNGFPLLGALAHTGLLSTAGMMLLAFATYPVAYLRRTRQAIEGGRPAHRPAAVGRLVSRLLNRALLNDGRRRAIFHWISQTLLRTQRTRLLLALVAAFVLAAPVAVWMVSLQPASAENAALLLQLARLAIPAAAFFAVAGLRTALRSPVAQSGAWIFRVIFGRPKMTHRKGAAIWVSGCACVVTTLTAIVVQLVDLRDPFRTLEFARQAGVGIILALLLTDILFFRECATPFTELRASSVNDLSITVVSCFVLFPVSALALVTFEPWLMHAGSHSLIMVIVAALVHAGFRILTASSHRNAFQAVDMEEDPLLPGEIGLRN
jgi:hypothetical protein